MIIFDTSDWPPPITLVITAAALVILADFHMAAFWAGTVVLGAWILQLFIAQTVNKIRSDIADVGEEVEFAQMMIDEQGENGPW